MKACTHLLSALLRGCMVLGFGGLAWLFPACEIAPPDEIPSGIIRPTILWEKDVTDATGSNGGLWNLAYWNQHLIYNTYFTGAGADNTTVFRSRASDGTVVDSLVVPGVGMTSVNQALVSGRFLVLPSHSGAPSASYTGIDMETMQLAWTTKVPSSGESSTQWGNMLLFRNTSGTWYQLNMETGTYRPLMPPSFTGVLAGTPRLFIAGTQDTTLMGIFYQETGPYRLQQFSLTGDSLQMDVPLTEFQDDRNMPYALAMNSTYVFLANDAQLSCRRRTDGAMVWFRTFSPDSGNDRTPLATEHEVIFSLYEMAGGNVFCHGLDPATGQDRWVREHDQNGIPISSEGGNLMDGMLFIYNFPFRLSDGVPYWNDVDGFSDRWNIPFMQLPVPDPVTKDLYYIGYENSRAKLYYVKNPK